MEFFYYDTPTAVNLYVRATIKNFTAEDLNKEFNEFLKFKGLLNEYKVEIVETK